MCNAIRPKPTGRERRAVGRDASNVQYCTSTQSGIAALRSSVLLGLDFGVSNFQLHGLALSSPSTTTNLVWYRTPLPHQANGNDNHLSGSGRASPPLAKCPLACVRLGAHQAPLEDLLCSSLPMQRCLGLIPACKPALELQHLPTFAATSLLCLRTHCIQYMRGCLWSLSTSRLCFCRTQYVSFARFQMPSIGRT